MILLFINLFNDDERSLINILYNEYKHAMFDAAYDIIHDECLSEDAIHTAFVNVSDHLHKLTDVKSNRTKAYLLTVVKNAAKKIYNKRKNVVLDGTVEHRTAQMTVWPDPQTHLQSKLSHERMVECLYKMKPKYRDVLLMKFYFGHKNEDIAKILGITESNVRKRLQRARKEFILRYGGEYGEEE